MCATPPHLEGAVLQEIPLDSFNCDANMRHYDNSNIFQQLEVRSQLNNNIGYAKKLNDDVSDFVCRVNIDIVVLHNWIMFNPHR